MAFVSAFVFLIQYGGADRFALARDIDPAYGRAFDRARLRGVEMLAHACRLDPEEIVVDRAVTIAEQGPRLETGPLRPS